MACEVCEHCQNPLKEEQKVVTREEHSYHKECHKCYVCSETDLKNAEMFKGVIFCSECSQRIFQTCSTTRRQKNINKKRSRDRSQVRKRKQRTPTRKRNVRRDVDRVIELATLTSLQLSSDSESQHKKSSKTLVQSVDSTHRESRNTLIESEKKELKKDSIETGTCTEITLELLRQFNPSSIKYNCIDNSPPNKPQRKKRDIQRQLNKQVPYYSDLRMAELGTSTEIAHMALRNKSEMPVLISSVPTLNQNDSHSVKTPNQGSDIFEEDGDWTQDSKRTTARSKKILDRHVGSIVKLPLDYFKYNILRRSSLVSIIMETDEYNFPLVQKMKSLFQDEINEHQGRGVRRLYSTINRRRVPYKLGWLAVNRIMTNPLEVNSRRSRQCVRKRCKHFKRSHSYRCMRAKVMRLAGPTKSELANYRLKIKGALLPKCMLNMIYYNRRHAIMRSEACGQSETTD